MFSAFCEPLLDILLLDIVLNMKYAFFMWKDIKMNVSEKVKKYLEKKLAECEKKLRKLKRKKRLNKIFYISTVLSSISISATVSVLSTMTLVPVIPITILSALSAILTGISSRFDFHHKKAEIKDLIDKQNKIRSKLDYVVSCNGDLTLEEYNQILKDFNC